VCCRTHAYRSKSSLGPRRVKDGRGGSEKEDGEKFWRVLKYTLPFSRGKVQYRKRGRACVAETVSRRKEQQKGKFVANRGGLAKKAIAMPERRGTRLIRGKGSFVRFRNETKACEIEKKKKL